MYSEKVNTILKNLRKKMFDLGISQITVEDFLLEVLIGQETLSKSIAEYGIDVESLVNEISQRAKSRISRIKNSKSGGDKPPESEMDVTSDDFLSDVISYGLIDNTKNGSPCGELGYLNIISSIPHSQSIPELNEILTTHGMDSKVFSYLIYHMSENESYDEFDIDKSVVFASNIGDLEPDLKSDKKEPKANLLTNLSNEYRAGNLEPLIGREKEVSLILSILKRRKKNNPIVVGNAGVGKTTLVHGVVAELANNDKFKDRPVYSLSVANLISGTKYRGEFELKVAKVIDTAKKENAILFIDEIHSIIRTGSSDSLGMADMLKEHLTDGSLCVIGATTHDEYEKIFKKDSASSRRFNKVYLGEMTMPETRTLLDRAKTSYEKHHGVTYSNESLDQMIRLANRHLKDVSFPDKVFDIMDELGASLGGKEKNVSVVENDVFKYISSRKGIPLESLASNSMSKNILNLSDKIKEKVYGQSKAIDELSDSMVISYAGLKVENKPIGSFLCVGPTGVGKTETAKVLAESLNMNFIRFDMTEFTESTSMNRLLGSQAGYVGHEEGGQLLKELSDNPHSVILFDEFEKAHSQVFNIFLQIMDEGEVTDAQGRNISFRDCIIIFTSNAGANMSAQEKHGIGFGSKHNRDVVNMDEIKNRFSPEFRNRLSSILVFNRLGPDEIKSIAKKSIRSISDTLFKNKGITLKCNASITEFIAKGEFDSSMGGRPVGRMVHNEISKKLAVFILGNGIESGQTIIAKKLASGVKFSIKM